MAGRIFGMIRHSEGNINCVVRERLRDSRAVVERHTGGKSFQAHLRRKPISLVTVTDGHLKLRSHCRNHRAGLWGFSENRQEK